MGLVELLIATSISSNCSYTIPSWDWLSFSCFGECYASSLYGFWLPLRYCQTFHIQIPNGTGSNWVPRVLGNVMFHRAVASDYSCDIVKLFIYKSLMGLEVIWVPLVLENVMLFRVAVSDYSFDIVKLFIYKSLMGLEVIEYFVYRGMYHASCSEDNLSLWWAKPCFEWSIARQNFLTISFLWQFKPPSSGPYQSIPSL